jgi:hypothetical protein
MLRWLCGVGVVVALAGVGFVAGGFAARTETDSSPRGTAGHEASPAPTTPATPTVRADIVPTQPPHDRVTLPARLVSRPAHAGSAAPRRTYPSADGSPAGGAGGDAPDRGATRGALPDDRSDTFPDGLPGMSPEDPNQSR